MKVCVFALAVLGLVARESRADNRYFSGSSCVGNAPGDTVNMGHDNFGCTSDYNTGTSPCSTPLLLVIPIVGNSSTTVKYTDIDVYYRKLTSDNLQCYADVTNDSGTAYQGSVAQTTATGISSLGFSGTQLPNGTTLAPQYVPGVALVQHVFCYVPGYTFTPDGCGAGHSCCTGPTTWLMSAHVTTADAF